MKYRSDFVSNSSSSSFCININVYDVNGNIYNLYRCPSMGNPEGSESADFMGGLADMLACKSVEEVANFLVEGVYDSYIEFLDECSEWEDDYDEDGEDDEYDCEEDYREAVKESTELFVKEITEGIKEVADIEQVEIIRDYDAWGECADLVADNDEKLCKLASVYSKATDEARVEAKKNLLDYINTPNAERGYGMSFGNGFKDFRYNFSGEDGDLEALVERLSSNYGPGSVSGEEVQKLDVKGRKFTKYAVFDLE